MFISVVCPQISFSNSFWQTISEECKDLLKHLLVVDSSKRYTVAQALAHPWFSIKLRVATPKFRPLSDPNSALKELELPLPVKEDAVADDSAKDTSPQSPSITTTGVFPNPTKAPEPKTSASSGGIKLPLNPPGPSTRSLMYAGLARSDASPGNLTPKTALRNSILQSDGSTQLVVLPGTEPASTSASSQRSQSQPQPQSIRLFSVASPLVAGSVTPSPTTSPGTPVTPTPASPTAFHWVPQGLSGHAHPHARGDSASTVTVTVSAAAEPSPSPSPTPTPTPTPTLTHAVAVAQTPKRVSH